MVRTAFPSFPPLAVTQQASQPHAHPLVQDDEREAMTVLEVMQDKKE